MQNATRLGHGGLQPIPVRTPRQKMAAVLSCREFLLRLTRHQDTKRVPRPIRLEALALLRQFPDEAELKPILEAACLPGDPAPNEAAQTGFDVESLFRKPKFCCPGFGAADALHASKNPSI